MKKTCVFITGTNGAGKTTLAKEIIRRRGGIAQVENRLTILEDKRYTLAGKYGDGRYGGVDGLSETRGLEEMARRAFEHHDVFICEGSYMNSFGMNLTNAMFVAERFIVVFLYAPLEELKDRLENRGKGGLTAGVIAKQRQALSAAQKWAQIGVRVMSYNTAHTAIPDIAEAVLNRIERE